VPTPARVAAYRERRVEVIAHELTGAEAEQVWADARALNHGFATYPAMTAGRTIQVFLLKPSP
jgi:hypothetical protein